MGKVPHFGQSFSRLTGEMAAGSFSGGWQAYDAGQGTALSHLHELFYFQLFFQKKINFCSVLMIIYPQGSILIPGSLQFQQDDIFRQPAGIFVKSRALKELKVGTHFLMNYCVAMGFCIWVHRR